VKFEPTTLNVNSGPPRVLLLGDIAVTAGVGPGLMGGADVPPPHAVSTLKDPRTATCKNNFIEPLRKTAESFGCHLLNLVTLLLGKVCVGQHASQAWLYHPDSGRNAGSLAKGSAVKSISSIT